MAIGTIINKINADSQVNNLIISVLFIVGVAGFEPTTPCSQSRCANRTALHPEYFTSEKRVQR